jgi:hypothetical protein
MCPQVKSVTRSPILISRRQIVQVVKHNESSSLLRIVVVISSWSYPAGHIRQIIIIEQE